MNIRGNWAKIVLAGLILLAAAMMVETIIAQHVGDHHTTTATAEVSTVPADGPTPTEPALSAGEQLAVRECEATVTVDAGLNPDILTFTDVDVRKSGGFYAVDGYVNDVSFLCTGLRPDRFALQKESARQYKHVSIGGVDMDDTY